ncbi:MAG: hypothetical protein R3330_17960, partial [Saprospiraceae bacterium]|nr:hypothetical protein [Saprospiraceae bacterium]
LYGDDECERAEIELFLGEATDDCTLADNIDYRWATDDNEYHGHGNTIIDELEVGVEHTVILTALDGCGNFAKCELTVELVDCKPPTPVCYDGIITVVMPSSGCVTVWAADLLQKADDNCSASWPGSGTGIEVSFSEDTDDKSREYCCDTIPNGIQETFDVEVWVTDEAGNQDYCTTRIIIQDTEVEGEGACPDAANLAALTGEVITEFTEAVEHVEVELTNRGEVFTTGRDGYYGFSNLITGESYTISPALDRDPLNGVSTFDLVLMHKHILGIDRLDSPYKIIAADINNSGSVSALDIVEARKLILGLYETFPDNESWRFVPADYNFSNPDQPFGFPEQLELDLTGDVQADFVGVKVGDVNESNVPHSLM